VYSPGERSGDWVKVRFDPSQEFVVGGIPPRGADGRTKAPWFEVWRAVNYRTFVQISDSELILPSRGFFCGGDCVYSVLPSILN